ncbi:MAG: hypothetical protein FJY75_08855 [Candidatus Eisenbacteria bacterium]|uniref:Uncharacterized protein n=1 Tax=Eiseniibacteriota bacterium TaxID=2212470 RepID=A0A937XA02_UNCEI|nr:hypothetical protein [Candidatus Eisenbacteria bacterium]
MTEPSRARAKCEQAQRHLERLKKALQQPGKDFEDSLSSFLSAFDSAVDLREQEIKQALKRRGGLAKDYDTWYQSWQDSLSEKDRVLWKELREQRNKDTHHIPGMDLPTEGESIPIQDVRSIFPPEVFELTGIRPEQVDWTGMAGYRFTRERLVDTLNGCERGLHLLERLLRESVVLQA